MEKFQDILNSVLKKLGIVSDKLVNDNDETVRSEKEKMMENEADVSRKNLIKGTAIAAAAIGLIWIITKKK